ncbi:MAG TPA: aspartyl protease family protein [Myxococcaceae bacterium]|jgi:hypothetical protein
MRAVLSILASCLLLTACAGNMAATGPQASAEARDPGVEALVDRYTAWRGGAAFERLQSIYLVADIESMNLKGLTREWRERSGRTRDEFELGPLQQVTVRAAGQGWVKDEALVNQLGRYELEDARRNSLIEFGDALRGGPGITRERLPDEEFDGRRFAVLRIRFGDADHYDLIIDPATGALHGKRIKRDARTRFTRMGDWRVVDGVRLPFLQEFYRPNGKLDATMRVQSASLNQRFADNLFAKPPSERTISLADGATSTGPIRFNYFNGNRIYIPATVNGQPVEVLLDSGADVTVLDKTFAERIGRQQIGSGVATGSGGEAAAGFATDVTIAIGNLTLKAPKVAVIDLGDVSKRLGTPLPVILGKDVFLQTIVDVDPSGPSIAFHDPTGFRPPTGAVMVPLEPLGALRVVPVAVEGLPEAPMIFDLGNGGYMSLTPHFWQANRLLENRRSSTRSAGAIGGESIHRVATLKSIRFAGVTFHDAPTEFTSPDVEIDSDREAGNVGMPLLGRFRLLIDFPGNRLYAIPLRDRMAEPFPRDRSGLRLVLDGNKLGVTYVAEGSPAAAAGWKKGDVVTAIDGKPVDPNTPLGPHGGFTFGPAGTVVTLTLSDGSTRKLTLADYF